MKMRLFVATLAFAAFTVSVISCGGGGSGGGGSEFESAASVSLDVVPQNIDSGDQMTIRTTIGDVNPNGVILKFRYPNGLSYVRASAFLKIHGRSIDLSPLFNESDAAPVGTAVATPTVAGTPGAGGGSSSSANTYLVFFLSQSLFKHPDDDEYKGDFGEVSLQLEGVGNVADDLVEVDADIDDPTTNNEDEFDVSAPEFSPQDEKSVSVTN